MPSGASGRIYSGRHQDTPPSMANPAWPRRGGGPAKTNDPDGSPLEDWYRPCGLFLPFRTFPSGPSQRVDGARVGAQVRKSVRRQPISSSHEKLHAMGLSLHDANQVIARAHAKAT